MTGSIYPSGTGLYRARGSSALAFAVGYVVIIGVYALTGVPLKGGEAQLNYAGGKTSMWWGIIGALSVAGSMLGGVLGMTVIIASILTTIWVLLVGRKLFGLSAEVPDVRGTTR